MKIKNIFIAGHNGMVGKAICKKLKNLKNVNIITANRKDLDLTNQNQVNDFFKQHKFDEIYIAAAKVGGIFSNNTYPADFIYQNITIQTNLINASHKSGIKKLLFLGSSCIYPKNTSQPISEKALLTGTLEQTNEPYAIAKITGIKMCESYNRQYGYSYRSIMPTNLYGPGDNYDPKKSHVIPGLINRFHESKIKKKPKVIVWGSGRPLREFMHVDDLAEASLHIMSISNIKLNKVTFPMLSHINIGSGIEVSILELAKIIKKIVGYNGNIIFDNTKPDGTFRKLLDSSIIDKLGWKAKIKLEEGLVTTYKDYLENYMQKQSPNANQ